MAEKETLDFLDGVPIVMSKKDYLQLLKQYICKEKSSNKVKTLVKTPKNNLKKH